MLFNKPSDMTYREWMDSDAKYLLNQIPKDVVEWVYEVDMTDEEKEQHPTYQEVKAHTTGHAEAVLVEYDAEQTTYKELCKLFFEIHDPAQTDGQGPDIGPQYRSEIFYLNEAQKAEAEAIIQLLREKGYEVNTRLTPASEFWPAEDYHQHYYDKTGGEPYCHIRVKKF